MSGERPGGRMSRRALLLAATIAVAIVASIDLAMIRTSKYDVTFNGPFSCGQMVCDSVQGASWIELRRVLVGPYHRTSVKVWLVYSFKGKTDPARRIRLVATAVDQAGRTYTLVDDERPDQRLAKPAMLGSAISYPPRVNVEMLCLPVPPAEVAALSVRFENTRAGKKSLLLRACPFLKPWRDARWHRF